MQFATKMTKNLMDSTNTRKGFILPFTEPPYPKFSTKITKNLMDSSNTKKGFILPLTKFPALFIAIMPPTSQQLGTKTPNAYAAVKLAIMMPPAQTAVKFSRQFSFRPKMKSA